MLPANTSVMQQAVIGCAEGGAQMGIKNPVRPPAGWRVLITHQRVIGKWKAFCESEHAEAAMRQWPEQHPHFFTESAGWSLRKEPLYTAPVEVSEVLEEVARALEQRAAIVHPASDGYRFAAQLVRSRMATTLSPDEKSSPRQS